MPTDLDEFLEHAGVKGMKWGVRKSDAPSSSTTKRLPSKTAVTHVGKEIAFGSIGPAALLLGAGPPISIALGISVAALRTPPVSSAIKQTSKASADLMKSIGDTKLSAMREAREAKADIREAGKSVNDGLIKRLA